MQAEGIPPGDEEPSARRSASSVRPGSIRPPQGSRPSLPPQPLRRARRLAVATVWVLVQVGLVLTASRRVDALCGFRIVPESSKVKVALFREVAEGDGGRTRIHVEDGVWSARDAGGLRRRFAWTDRVRRRELALLDQDVVLEGTAAATLAHLQAALDDVAAHLPDDADTHRLLLDVTVQRNGREPYVAHLASPERLGGGS
ncbi:MAG: hypothetical protein JWP97_1043 [Labilithrix sp.]|nr:hypothetical protein [Labilithrix sp.]